ncbi:MAG: phosphonoacetaldehyde hydrolase [bacterium]|nr:phosphonoacetaldehyde hydrolase [bacterium]
MDFLFRRSYRGPLKGVILDWAGTTMDHGCCAPAIVFIDLFKKHGVEVTIAEAREPMGAHKRTHIQQMMAMDSVCAKWNAAKGSDPTEADVDALFADFVPMQLETMTNYCELIPGCTEAMKDFRAHGFKIGTTTGYNREMLDICLAEGAKRGYVPDSSMCVSDVPAGRPAPWMAFKNAENLGLYPMEAVVKIGDTIPDINEGLNAGMWSVGVALRGNEVGLTESEFAALDPAAIEPLRAKAYQRLGQAGAHYVVDAIGDVGPVLDDIARRVAAGERP